MKNTKAKAAPAIVWEKGGWPCEWAGSIGGKPVFIISQSHNLYMYVDASISVFIKEYSCAKSAKRGAERFAKRMGEIFA